MNVTTVTTADRSLLRAVRRTLDGVDRALLAVAFVQEQGVHLLERELKALRIRKAETRLAWT
jgi:HKD family nuclease